MCSKSQACTRYDGLVLFHVETRSRVPISAVRTALAVAVLCIATIAAAQQRTGALTGCVTGPYPQPLPGTLIELIGSDGLRHTANAAAPSGCYEFVDLAPGAYAFSATLQGFITVRKSPVTIVPTTTARLDVKMRLGGICDCLDIPMKLADLWKPEFVALHLRIVGREPDPPQFAFAGSIARYAARVIQIWNADPATIGTEVSFLQFQMPREEPYSPTEELVVFLVWDPNQQLYVRVHDWDEVPMAFQLVDGRLVRSSRRLQSIELDQLDSLSRKP